MYNQKHIPDTSIYTWQQIGEKPYASPPILMLCSPKLFKEVHTLRVSAQGIESTTGSSGLSTTVAVKTSDSWTVKGNGEEENVSTTYMPRHQL